MAEPTSKTPSIARLLVALWLFGLAGILYLDRICIAQAADAIQLDLGLSNTQLSYAFMAFTLAYGLFEMPTGLLGDRLGSRRVLVRIVVWWSVFTALTGAVNSLTTLILVRFMFGAGEAGAFPNAARVFSTWFPAGERGRVQGLMLTASQLGGIAAPSLTAQLIESIGWRLTFLAFGGIGIVWAVGFGYWFRDNPADHRGVNEAELSLIRAGQTAHQAKHSHSEPVPWAAVFANTGLLALAVTITCSSFYSYFIFSWYPKYLMSAHGFENKTAGYFTSLVLAGGATGVFFGGMMADLITRHSAKHRLRRLLGFCTFSLSSLTLYLAIRVENSNLVPVVMTISYFAMQFTLPTWWSAAIEQSGRNVGILFGMLNMIGIFGALVSQGFAGWFADWRLSQGYTGRDVWDPMFLVYNAILFCGAIGWACYNFRPLPEPEQEEPPVDLDGD